MYYYITEPAKTRAGARSILNAKKILTSLGISGEFAEVSAARSIEELAELGVAKKYSTIVGMGSERLINKLAVLLAGTPYILGAMPIDDFDFMKPINGTSTIEEAAEALKYRLVKEASVMRIEPNKYFFTRAVVNFNKPTLAKIKIEAAEVEAECSQIIISGNGELTIKNNHVNNDPTQKIWNWIMGKEQAGVETISKFRGYGLSVQTGNTHPVFVGDEIIARTPMAAQVIPNCLKLIVKRDRISSESNFIDTE